MKMVTTFKWRGKHTNTLCRRTQKALKMFRKENPEKEILKVTRQIYNDYATVTITYHKPNQNYNCATHVSVGIY